MLAGYGESDIAKIWGGNVLRLLERAQSARKSAR
jgi:microsomal dipeptidase-like Zn-dependent dipeptidase